MLKYTVLALALVTGGAALADPLVPVSSAPTDGWTECSWSSGQRTGPCDPSQPYRSPATAPVAEPAPVVTPKATLFPEMNIRELCAPLGAAAPYCEQRNEAAREQLVELWQDATERTRNMCVNNRPAPPHARYVVIVSCVQAQANVAWEQRMKANGY